MCPDPDEKVDTATQEHSAKAGIDIGWAIHCWVTAICMIFLALDSQFKNTLRMLAQWLT